jgi:maleylpyruvate isomerase
MLVAHLRYGAEAAIRGIEAARRGVASLMYPGGDAQRDAEIASGAGMPASRLIADLASTCAHLEGVIDHLPDRAWEATVETRRGPVPVREVVLQRWLDVEVHHIDLEIGYSRHKWPEALVDEYLPGMIRLMPALRRRSDADISISGSWHFHRIDAPGEWTVYADGTAASVTDGHSKGDSAFRGSGRDLLAYILGRASIDDLETVGDTRKAANFKVAFPGP